MSAVRVGVVEDSREDFLAVQRILAPDVEVLRWPTGEQALAAFEGRDRLDDFALVIVDGNLPGMDGPEVVDAIRHIPGGDRARLAVLSGSDDPALVTRALRAGADCFASKGSTLQSLKNAVALCMTEADAPAS
ncbi:MAG: response regulator [Patulibacter minatonensis]